MSTDSVNLIQPGDAVDVVELAEPGVILETAGGVAGGTIGFGPGGTTGQVWGKNSGTDYDAGWIDGGSGGGLTSAQVIQIRQKASLKALRNWNFNAAKFVSGGQGDVLVLGDSISEGWYGNPAYENTWVGRFACNLARALNDKGRIGRWVAAGGGWYPTPHFSANGGAETERSYGISMRSRRMNVGAGTVTMTAGITCDRIRIHYLKANVFAQADLHFVVKDEGGTIVADSGSIYTYDGTLAANAYKENVWDSGALTRGVYTVEVTRETHGAYTGYAEWVGAYFFDGDYSTGHRVFNGSHYGFSTGSFTATTTWRDPIQSGWITPALVVHALGVNDRGTGATTWKTNTQTIFGYIRTDLAARGVQPTSFAILLPMAAATTSDATWEAFRTAAYEIAAAATDVDVWEWDELYGPVDSVDGDPLGITIDNTHPLTSGHLMLGQYAARQALQGLEGRGVEKVWAARGVADGFASLDSSALVPTAQLPSTTVNAAGPLASRPAAASTNAGWLYLATDDNGGTLYRSNGSTWVQTGFPVTPAAASITNSMLAGSIALSKLATIGTARILGNNTGSSGPPIELTAAQVKTLLAITSADLSDFASAAYSSAQTFNSQSGTTYTLVLGDAGKLVELSNAAAITVTVPTNASVAFAVGTRIDLAQQGAGQVTVSPAGGVTIRSTPGAKTRAQYSGATLVKRATDEWYLFGDLAA